MLPTESCKPAPYGRACVGCSRAKCKCFHRSDGPGCERCHRLGKTCEPSANVRQRRARGSGAQQPPTSSVGSSSSSSRNGTVPAGVSADGRVMDSSRQEPSPASTAQHGSPPVISPELNVAVDTDGGIVYFLPVRTTPSPIYDDVSMFRIPPDQQQKRIDIFRAYFLSFTPFIDLPPCATPAELLQKKPFLWLLIMALGTNDIGEQFRMEGTVWHIISRRIICEHAADLDLLQGLICFGIWSIYFKQDKFFIGMITQNAIAIAHQLGINTDRPSGAEAYEQSLSSDQGPALRANRSLEEKRTFLALFYLSSCCWYAEKRMPPMQVTAYLHQCLQMQEQTIVANKAPWDALLVLQVRCYMISNQLTCPPPLDPPEQAGKPIPLSTINALQIQLDEIRRNVPTHIQSLTATQLFLESTQLRLHEAAFSRPLAPDSAGQAQLQRLNSLEASLATLERFFGALFAMPLAGWMGLSVELFSQLMHCIVVIYKLLIITEAGWEPCQVKRRADPFGILDRLTDMTPHVCAELGLVDAPGARMGVMFKGPRTFQLVKQFLATRLPPRVLLGELPGSETVPSLPVSVPIPQQMPPPMPMPDMNGGMGGDGVYGTNGLAGNGFAGGRAQGMDTGGVPEEVYRRILFEEAWATDILKFSWDYPMQDGPGW